MKAKRFLRFSLYLAAASAMLAQSCFAYFDPATTSYVITIISAVVVACGTAAGIVFNKLKRRLKNKQSQEEEAPQNILPVNAEGENVVITADDLLSDDGDGNN
ncbi:MAG: hypothetical protein NC228_02065 [[Eubacterium] siraeum]|nr:hypothetical protein [[Eubacterium] siraeum]